MKTNILPNWHEIDLFLYSAPQCQLPRQYLYKWVVPRLLSWAQRWKIDLRIKQAALENTNFPEVEEKEIALIISGEHFEHIVYIQKDQKYIPKGESCLLTIDEFVEHVVEKCKNQISKKLQQYMENNYDRFSNFWEQERHAHECLLCNYNRTCFGREDFLLDILEYISSDKTSVLVLYGETGIGKSTLLAKSYTFLQHQFPQKTFFHCVGATPVVDDFSMLWFSLFQFFYPNKVFEYDRLRNCLQTQKTPTLLLLDGLDRLEFPVEWLPQNISPHIKFIITLPESMRHRYINREWQWLKVKPFTYGELKHILRSLCFSQNIDIEQVKALYKKDDINKPLYLKIAFDIFSYLSAEDLHNEIVRFPKHIEKLFELQLIEMEKDYGAKQLEMLLCLIKCSKKQLSNKTLQELLVAVDEEKKFLQILSHLQQHLHYQKGGWKFSLALDLAVKTRYLSHSEKREHYELLLKEYFDSKNNQN